MKLQEIIEDLKKTYEGCSIYFDIQENAMIIKNNMTKDQKAEWDKKEPELRKSRIELQILKNIGETDLPEPPPVNIEDFFGDSVYKLGEAYFEWIITKLDEWETNQNKKVENVGLLIEFLEWTATEQKKMEETSEQKAKEFFLELLSLELEEKQKKFEEFLKSIHPDFTPEFQEQWGRKGFGFEECKEWISAGLRPKDSIYAYWLRDICEFSPSDYLNFGNDKLLREKCQQTLLKGIDDEDEQKELLVNKLRELSLENNENNSEEGIKNILLIGRTGSGKSTLANVLVNKNGEFGPVFKESSRSISETKHIQTEKFTVNLSRDGVEKINYLVMDTAGFGDTQLDNKEVLDLLKDLVPIIKQGGLNRIFFVTNGRFGQSEIETYKLLETVIFDKETPKYTTIVRTNFDNFEDNDCCEEDRKSLRSENPELFEILRSSKIIYVNNPPLVGRSMGINKEVRNESRKRLLTYLGTCQDNYYPSDLKNLNERIDKYVTSEEELKREIAIKEEKIQEGMIEFQKEVESVQEQKLRELKITERNFERQVKELRNRNQKQIKVTNQEFDEAHQSHLKMLQEIYEKRLKDISQEFQSNLVQAKNVLNQVQIGKPVCHHGHDKNIQTYDKSGSLIPDNQSGFIGHIYCPTCGVNDYDYILRDATTYTLEEWGKKNSQDAAERRRKMQEVIDEYNRKQQEIINSINQERINSGAESARNIQERKRLQEQIVNQQEELEKEIISQRKKISEGRINSSNQGKIDKLKKDLAEKEQELKDHISKSQTKRDNAQLELYAYIEQRRG
jgi:uncharacterized Zn finger protein (UPF0148 family)/GTP-binding protein EngB required for normal cell division